MVFRDGCEIRRSTVVGFYPRVQNYVHELLIAWNCWRVLDKNHVHRGTRWARFACQLLSCMFLNTTSAVSHCHGVCQTGAKNGGAG